MEEQKASKPELMVPQVVVFLVEGLLAMGAERTQGIFRLNPKFADEAAARAQIDAGAFVLPQEITICSSMLKTWMRMLPEALIPTRLYEKAVAAESTQDVTEGVLRQLSAHSFATVAYITHFIAHLSADEFVAHTQMTPENIAGVFAPCFLHCPYDDLEKRLAFTTKEKNFVLLLLEAAPGLPDCGFRTVSLPSASPSPSLPTLTPAITTTTTTATTADAPQQQQQQSLAGPQKRHPPTPAPGFLSAPPLDIPPPTTPPMPHMPPPPIPLNPGLDIPPPPIDPPSGSGQQKRTKKSIVVKDDNSFASNECNDNINDDNYNNDDNYDDYDDDDDPTPPQPKLPPPPAPTSSQLLKSSSPKHSPKLSSSSPVPPPPQPKLPAPSLPLPS